MGKKKPAKKPSQKNQSADHVPADTPPVEPVLAEAPEEAPSADIRYTPSSTPALDLCDALFKISARGAAELEPVFKELTSSGNVPESVLGCRPTEEQLAVFNATIGRGKRDLESFADAAREWESSRPACMDVCSNWDGKGMSSLDMESALAAVLSEKVVCDGSAVKDISPSHSPCKVVDNEFIALVKEWTQNGLSDDDFFAKVDRFLPQQASA